MAQSQWMLRVLENEEHIAVEKYDKHVKILQLKKTPNILPLILYAYHMPVFDVSWAKS